MRRPSNLWALLGALVSLFSAAPALAQSAAVRLTLLQQAPYPGATVALDFIGSNTNGQPYCRVGGSAAPCSSLLTTSRASIGYGECNGQLILFQANQPRITCQGLLAEEARTNLALQSQAFDAAAWTKSGSSVSADQTVAPDATLTADKLIEGVGGTFHLVQQDVTVTANTAYSVAFYVAAAGRGFVRVQLSNTSASTGGSVDLTISGCTATAPTVFGTGAAFSASASRSANGFCRVILTGVIDATSTTARVQVLLESALGTINYSGDGLSGVYLWQADAQAGPFITSPILTTSATATRPADAINSTGLATLPAGTLISKWNAAPVGSSVAFIVPSDLSDGSLNNFIDAAESATAFDGIIEAGGVQQYRVSSGAALTLGAPVASGISWSSAGAAYANSAGQTQTAGAITVPTFNQLWLGRRGGSPVMLNNYIQRVLEYPRTFSTAEIQAAIQ